MVFCVVNVVRSVVEAWQEAMTFWESEPFPYPGVLKSHGSGSGLQHPISRMAMQTVDMRQSFKDSGQADPADGHG